MATGGYVTWRTPSKCNRLTNRLDNRVEITNHAVGLADFIFNVGYMGQNWADIQVTFFDTGVKLHRSELDEVLIAVSES